METVKEMFIKQYEKMKIEQNDLITKYGNDLIKKINGKTLGESININWWNNMFANTTIAIFLEQNGIKCWDPIEFQTKRDGPNGLCTKIQKLYKSLKNEK